MFDFLIRLSLRSRALVVGVFAILAGAALLAWRSMPINVFPAFATPRVVIGTTLPGMAPRDMEALITYPIETAVSGTMGIRVVRSKTTLGVSLVTVVFHAGTNVYHDRQLLAERLQDLQSRLPAGVHGPEIFPLTSAIGWLVKYSLTSPIVPAQELRTLADWVIRPRLLRNVNPYLNDTPIGHVLHGPRRFAITLRVAHGARRSARDLRHLPVRAPALGPHAVVPLTELASVRVRPVPFEIRRAHGHRVLLLTFDVAGRALSSVVREVKANMAKVPLPRAYFVRYGGTFRSQERANTTLWRLGLLALIVSALLLQKAFGSLRAAVLVLVNLPLAMAGGVAAFLMTGSPLSTAAVIGFIALFGITARNGIILISHYKTLETDGRSVDEVVREGTLGCLIPILMTSITPGLASLPLLWGSPVGKELERPLAYVALGGLATSTLLNLIVIPSVYHVLRRRDHRHLRTAP